jgi:transposase InsO family protein
MRYRFIDTHRGRYPVALLCQTVAVSRAGYYAWRRRVPSRRALANVTLRQQVHAAYQTGRGTYGYRRVHAAVVRQTPCSRNRVARLMRQDGLRARRNRRYRTTTRSAHDRPIAANRLNREFVSPAPDRKWLSDITYVRTAEGWLYLAVILDLYSRRVVGWALAPHLKDELTLAALQMALGCRSVTAGLLHHSDRGSQYASIKYRRLLARHHLAASMSRPGNAYDNAPVESFFATLKSELLYHRHFQTRDQARRAIFEYIEVFYNRQRLHSALGYRSPVEFESLPCPA